MIRYCIEATSLALKVILIREGDILLFSSINNILNQTHNFDDEVAKKKKSHLAFFSLLLKVTHMHIVDADGGQ